MIKTVYGPPPADAERIEDIELGQEEGSREENVVERVAAMVLSPPKRQKEIIYQISHKR